MATGRITKRAVEAVPVPGEGKRAYLWDDLLKGFGVMVTPKAVRSYLVQYRIGGRVAPTRRYTIGHHGSPWTADRARDRATDLLELVRKKIDPVDADRERLASAAEQKETDERLAFSPYADSFIRRHADRRGLRSADDIRAVFRRDLKPYFGDKAITAITRADVSACLDHIGERSGSAANKAHKWLRKMFAFAVDKGDLASSPMEGMGKPHAEGKRKRWLKGPELVVVWDAAGDLGFPFGPMVRLLLLTGQRLREVAGIRWEEVDLSSAVWIIPGARTKNKRDHLVPLPRAVVALLASIQPDAKARKGLILSTNGRTAPSGFSRAKVRLDGLIASRLASYGVTAPIAPWVLHDLRRSVSSGCQSLGRPIEHVEALLNHVSGTRGGLVETYQLYQYRAEKTAALNAWAAHLSATLRAGSIIQSIAEGAMKPGPGEGSNVVPLAAARA